MASPSYILKLERAGEHLDSLNSEIATWIDTEPFGIVDEPDPEPPPQPLAEGCIARRGRINAAAPVPDRLSILIGDCAFQLRSCLSHLALTLARTNTPGMNGKLIRYSEFPIFASRPAEKEWPEKIGCIAPLAQAEIKALQPYHRGQNYALDPLWQIHEINRIDKHQTLAVCAASNTADGRLAIAGSEHGDENIGVFGYSRADRCELKLDAILIRWSAFPADPSLDMCMHHRVPIEILVEYGTGARQPVIPLLDSCCNFISNVVIPKFAKFL